VLASRLAKLGVHAVDLGHIGLFWRQGDPEHKQIRIAPTTILPPTLVTKAEIKAYGKLEKLGGMYWPAYDHDRFAISQMEESERAKALVARLVGLRNRGVCVLVGAGGGIVANAIAPLFERVYAFEPDFGLFGSLRRNLRVPNVAYYKEAVGNLVGNVRMRPGKRCGDWAVDIDGPCTVMQNTIDALELDGCDVIITQLGAYSAEVLNGARETIRTFNSVVLT
jgi:hypothetical protein